MFETLDDITTVCERNFFDEEKIKYEKDIINIFNGNIPKETNNDFLLNIIGLYYEIIEKNYDEMKKYYFKAVEFNNIEAMNGLSFYYTDIKNYKEMKKYYLMAIELGDTISMYNLGYYYQRIKNYEEMKKYYLMAFENGNNDGLYYLMEYYSLYNNNNYKELEDILLLYFEKGNKEVIIYLAKYYEKFEIDYDKMEKYYLIGIEKNILDSKYFLNLYLSEKMKK